MLSYAYNMSKREAELSEHELVELTMISIFNGNFAAFEKVGDELLKKWICNRCFTIISNELSRV